MNAVTLDDVRRAACFSHQSQLSRDELRRALSAIVTLDAALLSHVLLALLLDTAGGATLVVLHATHVFLLLLGTASLYHTLFSHTALGWLQHLAVAAALFDVGAAVARLVLAVRATDTDSGSAPAAAALWIYVGLALALCAVDVAYAFTSDALRAYAPPSLSNRDTAHAAVVHTQQRSTSMLRAGHV